MYFASSHASSLTFVDDRMAQLDDALVGKLPAGPVGVVRTARSCPSPSIFCAMVKLPFWSTATLFEMKRFGCPCIACGDGATLCLWTVSIIHCVASIDFGSSAQSALSPFSLRI